MAKKRKPASLRKRLMKAVPSDETVRQVENDPYAQNEVAIAAIFGAIEILGEEKFFKRKRQRKKAA